jgi:hypothetical protein
MVFMLSFFDVPSERALLLSVLVGISAIAVSLPGGLLWMFTSEAKTVPQSAKAGSR